MLVLYPAFLGMALQTGLTRRLDDTPVRIAFAAVAVLDAVYTLGTLLHLPLVACGILRTQFFDIDPRIRWTISQSTVASAVVAIVYLVAEGTSRLLSAELGNMAGLFAAAVVMFFLAPLQRLAETAASAAWRRHRPERVSPAGPAARFARDFAGRR